MALLRVLAFLLLNIADLMKVVNALRGVPSRFARASH